MPNQGYVDVCIDKIVPRLLETVAFKIERRKYLRSTNEDQYVTNYHHGTKMEANANKLSLV